MAKNQIYSGVRGIKAPEFNFNDFNVKQYEQEVEAYEKKLRAFCKKESKSKYSGEIIKFPVADGYARYMVLSLRPTQLIYIDEWDGYQTDVVNYIPPNEIKKLVDGQKALNKLFGKPVH